MPIIRIPEKDWGRVWRELVASGPISRVSAEHVYDVSETQIRLLRRKKLPFNLVQEPIKRVDGKNGQISPPL